MTKLDIMNRAEPSKWAIVNGKVQKVEEIIPEVPITEKEEKKEVEKIIKDEITLKDKFGATAIVDGKKLKYNEEKSEWEKEKTIKKSKIKERKTRW